MHAQLYGLVGQTTPSSPRAAQVTWQLGGPWLSIQILLTPTNKPKAISQKVSSYLEKMAEFCFKLLRLCAVIHTQGLPKAPNSLPVCLSGNLQASLGLLEHGAPNGRALCTATWICTTFSCSGHSKSKVFLLLGKWE